MNREFIQVKVFNWRRPTQWGSSIFIAVAAAICLITGCAYDGRRDSPGIEERYLTSMDELTSRLGIEIISLRTTANGRMLDLRYRVSNPELARTVTKRDSKLNILIFDAASNKTLSVPTTHLGMLRTKSFNPKRNRVYYVLFDNAEKLIKPGSVVSVWFGDIKVEGIKTL